MVRLYIILKLIACFRKREMAEQICQAKIKDTQAKYERVLWVLGFIILAFFAKIFIKK